MAIAEDAVNTPAVQTLTADTSGVITTPSFTPAANSLLVAIFNVGYSSSATPSLTISDSASGSWTAGPSAVTGTGTGSFIWFRYLSSAPGSMTVTVTDSTHTAAGRQLAVRVLTGTAATRMYATQLGESAPANTAAFSATIGTQATGSWAYVAACELGAAGQTFTPTAATTTLSGGDFSDTTDNVHMAVGRQTSASASPGIATTLGWNGTTGTANWTIAILEILPAGVPPVGLTLFGQAATGSSIAADTAAYTMGVQFSVSQAGCTQAAVWFYSAAGAATLPDTIALYQVTGGGAGTLVSSQAAGWSGAAGAGWIRAAWSTPPSLTNGQAYKACILDSAASGNWYAPTGSYWSSGAGSAGITNGVLAAPDNAAADVGQDTFNASGTLSYPASTFNADNYWIDPEITVPAGGTNASAGLASSSAAVGATADAISLGMTIRGS